MATIRLMEEKDIPSVQHVAHMSWHDTYEGIIPKKVRNVFLEKAYSRPMLEKKLENGIIFVAIHEDIVNGYAHFTPVDENGDSLLAAIYLLPTVQNKGLGSMLLEEESNNSKVSKQLHLKSKKKMRLQNIFIKEKNLLK